MIPANWAHVLSDRRLGAQLFCCYATDHRRLVMKCGRIPADYVRVRRRPSGLPAALFCIAPAGSPPERPRPPDPPLRRTFPTSSCHSVRVLPTLKPRASLIATIGAFENALSV